MAHITIAALQAQIAELEAAQRGLVETIDDLRQQVAERDARILRGHDVVRSMKAEIAVLREQLAAKPKAIFIKPRMEPKPVVTRFYRGGQLWEKTRVGNAIIECVVEESAPAVTSVGVGVAPEAAAERLRAAGRGADAERFKELVGDWTDS